jgi:hypothetical protein
MTQQQASDRGMPAQQDQIAHVQSTPRAVPDPQLVARKVDQFFELCELAKELALEGIKHRHPAAGPAELRRLLAERLAVFREGKWRRHG